MSQQVTGSEFSRLIGTATPVHIVDVGANPIDGLPPYTSLLRSGAATVLGFEPNPAALAQLHAVKGAQETYLPHAIGDGQEHTLYVCAAPGMTSLLRPNPEILKYFHGFAEWGRVIEQVTIPTVRLDDIPEARGADLLKIDIQGGELMALRHAEALLQDLLVIQIEVEFLPLYFDQPLFSEIEQYLRARGFMFHRFFPTCSRTIVPVVINNDIYQGLSQLVWADAVFVRDFTRLEAYSNTQLLAASAVLHECYGSFDLVAHLLAEYDRRTCSALGTFYLAGAQKMPVGTSLQTQAA